MSSGGLTFLKKPSDMRKAPAAQSLRHILHELHSRYEEHRSLDVIHASDMTKYEGFCARYYALCDLTGHKPHGRFVPVAERMLFRIGHQVQNDLVQDLADANRAVTYWRCVACHHVAGPGLRPDQCETCKNRHTRFEPVEMRLTSPLTGASAGFDTLYRTSFAADAPLRIVEIKTIQEEDFKTLKAPLSEAKWRSNLYLRIAAEVQAVEPDHSVISRIDTATAVCLYTVKGGYGVETKKEAGCEGIKDRFTPFKEYFVHRDDRDTDEICQRAKSLKAFRRDPAFIPSGICDSFNCKRAQKCGVRAACFGGDYPAAK